MNILIPHNWLLEHLDTKASPEKIAKHLSLSGPSVERIEQVEGEPVYDIEVTTNRVDSMSIYGIAREAATILPEFDISATLKPVNLKQIQSQIRSQKKPLDLTIKNNPKLCHRILAIKLSNVAIGPSPKWLQQRLLQVGQRPLNNVIDVTNYIMWEYGHPIHAFDYDRLTEKKIIVREAKKGETFTTLDNQTKITVGGEVIFDDGTGTIIDVPGIMGTKNTVVTDKTTNVLLWIEAIDANKIRFASMTHDLRSQAAVLNEKHVDPHLGYLAIHKATQLVMKTASATVSSQLYDLFPNKNTPDSIMLKRRDIQRYLGIDIEPQNIEKILTSLGCKTEYSQTKDSFQVTPPTYRQNDITVYQDLIEEIARIYGYHRLESKLIDTPIPVHTQSDQFDYEFTIKQWLAGWGFQEMYTYSMVSKKLAQLSGYPLKSHIEIKNPLTDDLVYMRRSLIPSLLDVYQQNKVQEISLFELQHVYHQNSNKSALPTEQLQLALLSDLSYPKFKGILDALFEKLYINGINYTPKNIDHNLLDSQHSAIIQVDHKTLGYIGKLDHPKNIFAAVINMDLLLAHTHTHPMSIPIFTNPPIIEDLTFTIPHKTPIEPIINSIKKTSDLATQVKLKTIYQQNFTFTIHYRHPNKPLTDVKVAPIRKKIVAQLSKNHNAKLVGELQ